MKLDNRADRFKLVDGLLKKSFKLDALWVKDEATEYDWAANLEIMNNLFSICDMMHTEKIFMDAIGQMELVRTRNFEDKEIFMSVAYESLISFVDTLLLRQIEFSFDELSDYDFKTELGKNFHKDVRKKLDALIKKYQDLYDL